MSNFFFSHTVFLLNQKIVSPFIYIFDIISLFVAESEEPKIGIWSRGLTLPKLKAFADDKWNVTQYIECVCCTVENIVVTSIFSFSGNIFETIFPQGT